MAGRLAGQPRGLRAFLKPETTLWQYTHGVTDPTRVSPDGYSLDNFYLARPGADEVQLDLFGDYKSNVALYPTFQDYFRTHKPPFLAVWGKNDPFFLPPGAEAFKRDIRTPSCASSTPATSRWKPTPRKSRRQSATSFIRIALTPLCAAGRRKSWRVSSTPSK